MEAVELPNAFFFKKEKTQIHEKDPFSKDLFKRAEEATFLKQIIDSVEQPVSIAVTADFGSGKTYFRKRFH
jgi:type II secretory pathway predicted ATPase ExeA